MRKNLTTVLLVLVLLLTSTPAKISAQECTEHTWGEWHEMYKPTCTKDGLQRRICNECYAEETKPIPAIGHHTWGEWYEIFEPTCTKDGVQRRHCNECYAEETKPIPAIGHHAWGKWETSYEATCENTGLSIRTCTICYEVEEKEIPKTQKHSWERWRTTKKATALSKGTKTRSCSECYKTQKKSIPKLKAKISLRKKFVTIKSGKHYTIKIKSKTYGDKVKKWTSSNKKIATVNLHGKVTGKNEGVATITLKMKSGVKATCKVKVTKPKQNSNQQSNGSGSEPDGDDTPPPSSSYVWIPNSGKKYHSSSSCSGMKNPRQVTLQDAINAGYEPCSKCY